MRKRGTFLRQAGLGIATALASASLPEETLAAGSGPASAASNPDQALSLLKAGNARFVSGNSTCGPLTARRMELTQGQSPFAIVLGCSDSRVPIETVFDQVPGHVFVVRLAGNFADDNGLGSMEYGVAVLKASLILVLGHEACGAVDATMKYVDAGTTQPGHIQGLITAIAPAVQKGESLDNAIAANVKANVAAIPERSEIIAAAIKSGQIHVVGGVYELHTGKVRFL
ncbi:MAG TPA: carbonic anhydrase [Candidatus Baltobacteraceae bacterium]|jgi:carbonic anhydrase|nr:carbonic anhydrase [Candidatus Baltobacteraceae bacterium]